MRNIGKRIHNLSGLNIFVAAGKIVNKKCITVLNLFFMK